MKEKQLIYVCSGCGEEFLKWQGKCENCGSWNTLKEFKAPKTKGNFNKENLTFVKLPDIKIKDFKRLSSDISEIDRVLGGGIVPGSVVLLGGEPGIGKSTLLMQLASNIKNTLYISGEESLQQIKMRADRLNIKTQDLKIAVETNIDSIEFFLENQEKPALIIIDSIQTVYSEEFPSTAGSLVQVRESALKLQRLAKRTGIPIVLVGHVTKEGSVAGPKTLEHMVDVVLYLEGERFGNIRILRTTKNRFGETSEIGIFEIGGVGLEEVKNPSKLFLDQKSIKLPGSVVTATIEGTRPFLVEIQALTSQTSFGYPKRTASGFDLNRLNLIIAILTNRGGLNLSSEDVYLNVAGGFYLKEPAVDLAVAAAIISSFKKIPINNKIIFGELGLGGEIRPVSFENKRMAEAQRLGFENKDRVKNIGQFIKELNV